jgi:hypothetical protein
MDQARKERIRGLTRRLELLQAEIGDLSKETESAQISSDAAGHFEAAIDGIESAIKSLRDANR